MMDQNVAYYSFAFYAENSGNAFMKVKTEADWSVARPLVHFTDDILLSSTSIPMMPQFSYINQNSFSGKHYRSLELADINLWTHTAIENRPNIELSLTFHNRGESTLEFNHKSLDI